MQKDIVKRSCIGWWHILRMAGAHRLVCLYHYELIPLPCKIFSVAKLIPRARIYGQLGVLIWGIEVPWAFVCHLEKQRNFPNMTHFIDFQESRLDLRCRWMSTSFFLARSLSPFTIQPHTSITFLLYVVLICVGIGPISCKIDRSNNHCSSQSNCFWFQSSD